MKNVEYAGWACEIKQFRMTMPGFVFQPKPRFSTAKQKLPCYRGNRENRPT
jgi:hypothetical protein